MEKGFTMLELVVVVAILAIVASAAIMSFGNTTSDAQEQTTRYSLKQIAGAVEAYYEDNKINFPPPGRESPADLAFLFNQADASAADWSADYRQGWRGPYLKQAQYMYVDIGNDLRVDGRSEDVISEPGDPTTGLELSNLIAIADPYDHEPTPANYFEWQKRLDTSDPDADFEPLDTFGRPYLIIDLLHMSSQALAPGVPRVVSLGPNGIYEPIDCDYSETNTTAPDYCSHDVLCNSDGDDLVLCLR
jgi:prepilin-type N-terminal cleavage/methylation domain-containing protein